MNKLLRAVTIAALTITTSTAVSVSANAAETFVLDPTHTNITWTANHFGFSSPNGKFAKAEGTVNLDEAKPENSKVEVTIDTTSVITGIPKFDEHLKSKDFFEVEKYPTAKFVSTKIEGVGTETATVIGDLTLKGVTKPVTLDVKLNKIGEHPFTKKKTAGFSATTTIKRSDFGISYGLPGVADEVKLTIESEASVK